MLLLGLVRLNVQIYELFLPVCIVEFFYKDIYKGR